METVIEMTYGEGNSHTSYKVSFVGFDTESVEYLDKIIEQLKDDLERYNKRRNKVWMYKTERKLQYYIDKRYHKANNKHNNSGKRPIAWTKEMDQYLRENATKMTNADIGYNLGMSATAVSNHRKILGLTDYKRAKKVENDGK